MKFNFKYNLSTRFLIILIPTVITFMLVLYVFLEINTFNKIKHSQQKRIETLANFSSSALSSPLWNYDRNAINFILSSLTLEPDFQEASVFDHNNKKIMSIGNATGFKTIQIINSIKYDRGYGLKNIGEIVIHLRQKTLWNNIIDKVHESLLMMGFIIIAILISIIFGTKKIVTIPLQKLSSSIEKTINLETPSPVEWNVQDELGKLINGYNKMIVRLKKSNDERILTEKALQKAHDELEQRVEERTTELVLANETLKQKIEDRKKAEEALRENEEKYRTLFDMESDALALIEIETGNMLDVNKAFIGLYGYSKEEVLRMKNTDFSAEPKMTKQASQALKTYIPIRYHKKKDGTIFPTEITVSILEYQGRNVHIAAIRDITERKRLEAHLQQVQKLESIGILAGGIAHDFNNLLSVIMGNIELAQDDMKPEVGISEFLAEAEKASLQAQELTKQLITFSKGGAPVKKIGSIGELVKETTNFSIFGANVKCEFSIPHDLWLVDFDGSQMKHAINNIIVNAVEFMTDGGSIDVRAENFAISSETIEQSLSLSEGKYVKISIRDQGVGIPEEHLAMIFDPYFSTKEMGIQKGMGLGLATTYSIINRHDGHITVESEVRVGTTFTLYLPAHKKDIRELKPVEIPKPKKPAIRTGRILVMDDEDMIRNLANQMLNRFGYDAELAKDGVEAIELYKKALDSGKPFEMIILDLTVKGGMGGKDAVKKILGINPQAKAIVSSGYSNDPVMTNHRGYGFIAALPKPYTMKDLSETLNKITKD